MREESNQNQENKLNSTLETMSREEIVQILTELMKHSEEIENGSKLLATHLKVLCYKNGGSLTYTKDEFDAAAKDNRVFSVNYEADNVQEICLLRLQPRQKIDD
ncbi:hypothetical protein E4K67_10545 [Desulfosporosinus fructosivorans]|uniref:Uncharacterized protein n=1 Tax=Desulfosporosinus fructosivorans TaxID=2018669 RepID=A0A4Z0R5J6_9FIRM|nr:hypothetical protein [Desulfosporosinus fructosivorans]TGE38381.1 hypothetical protein E4K67_10545 [Desulfosporosinus fructosivorans]